MQKLLKLILLLFFISFYSCNSYSQEFPGAKEQTIEQGNHFVKTSDRIVKIRWRPKVVEYDIVFSKNTNYDLKGVDQQDWNKLIGLYFNLANTRDNTVMVGWRYNIEEDIIEVCPYYHIDGPRVVAESPDQIVKIKRGETLRVKIEVEYKRRKRAFTVRLSNGTLFKSHHQKYDAKLVISNQINFYFGGNRTAPQDVTIYVKQL